MQPNEWKVCVLVEPNVAVLVDIERIAVADHWQGILFRKIRIFEEVLTGTIEANKSLLTDSATKHALVKIAHPDFFVGCGLNRLTRISEVEG